MADPERPFEQRCQLADMLIRTAIVEAIPGLTPNELHKIEVPLAKQLKNSEEARWFVLESSGDLLDDMPLSVKNAKLSIIMVPVISALITVEMGDAAVEQI